MYWWWWLYSGRAAKSCFSFRIYTDRKERKGVCVCVCARTRGNQTMRCKDEEKEMRYGLSVQPTKLEGGPRDSQSVPFFG